MYDFLALDMNVMWGEKWYFRFKNAILVDKKLKLE